MKASELRIGNIIAQDTINAVGEAVEIIMRVSLMEIRDAVLYEDNWTGKPIPLTEEWLLKFGMSKTVIDPHWTGPKEQKIMYRDDSKPVNFYVLNGRAWLGLKDLCPVRYVHQLQNLYFALTGEELEIK